MLFCSGCLLSYRLHVAPDICPLSLYVHFTPSLTWELVRSIWSLRVVAADLAESFAKLEACTARNIVVYVER